MTTKHTKGTQGLARIQNIARRALIDRYDVVFADGRSLTVRAPSNEAAEKKAAQLHKESRIVMSMHLAAGDLLRAIHRTHTALAKAQGE